MTQAQLSAAVSVSQACVGQWERGETTPRPTTLNALLAIFGLSAGDIDINGDPVNRSIITSGESAAIEMAAHVVEKAGWAPLATELRAIVARLGGIA